MHQISKASCSFGKFRIASARKVSKYLPLTQMSSDEAKKAPEIGSIGWFDLTVPSTESVRDFYTKVAGWTYDSLPMDGGKYSDYVRRPVPDARSLVFAILWVKIPLFHLSGCSILLSPMLMLPWKMWLRWVALKSNRWLWWKVLEGSASSKIQRELYVFSINLYRRFHWLWWHLLLFYFLSLIDRCTIVFSFALAVSPHKIKISAFTLPIPCYYRHCSIISFASKMEAILRRCR